ncbi:hypothetical protein [Streptomyces sp. NPDC058955]|uniref:hypothetical protein n=1 Tax=unclassified Streptomyces TaxID=2593676 RepID=UPI00364BBB30
MSGNEPDLAAPAAALAAMAKGIDLAHAEGTPTELVDESRELAWHTRATLWGTTTWNKSATTYTPSASRAGTTTPNPAHLGIPMSQHPMEIERVPMTDRDGDRILDDNHDYVMTRPYICDY